MRKISVFFFLLAAALSSCNKNKVNLIDTNAQNEIPSLGNLTFTFDKNLCPDSLLNYWDRTEYIIFEPKSAFWSRYGFLFFGGFSIYFF